MRLSTVRGIIELTDPILDSLITHWDRCVSDPVCNSVIEEYRYECCAKVGKAYSNIGMQRTSKRPRARSGSPYC